jgi:hypothetical protein
VKHSGKCLQVAHSKHEDQARVIEYTLNGTDAQKWRLRDAGDGYFYIIAKHSDKALHCAENGDGIYQFTFNFSDNQKWKFEPV